MELAESKQDSAKPAEKDLMYNVRIPLELTSRQPIPKLTGIWINEREYCTGPPGESLYHLCDIKIIFILPFTSRYGLTFYNLLYTI